MSKHKEAKTYFLEKTYEVDEDGKMKPLSYGFTIVRPCMMDYQTVLDWNAGKLPKSTMLTLEGQVAAFRDYSQDMAPHGQTPRTIEEWLIELELEKGIRPDFEQTLVSSSDRRKEYVVKLVDLHTNNIVFDAVGEGLKKLREYRRMKN